MRPAGDFPSPWPRPEANLTFVANPNSPSGTMVPNAALETLARSLRGPLVVDEAYVDFAETNAIELARRLPEPDRDQDASANRIASPACASVSASHRRNWSAN